MKRKRFLYRLQHDDEGADKLEDQYPFNTYLELFIAWLATAVSILALTLLADWLGKIFGLHN